MLHETGRTRQGRNSLIREQILKEAVRAQQVQQLLSASLTQNLLKLSPILDPTAVELLTRLPNVMAERNSKSRETLLISCSQLLVEKLNACRLGSLQQQELLSER